MSDPNQVKQLMRCISETERAIYFRRALAALDEVVYECTWPDFIELASLAMYDQMFIYATKVMDPREKAGLIDLMRRTGEPIDQRFDPISAVQPKLQHLRDKTLAHLDTKGVRDPASIWREADISGIQIGNALEAAHHILKAILLRLCGTDRELEEYDGADAIEAARHLLIKKHGGQLRRRPNNRAAEGARS